MSGATTELNLATAVDADDNADYLTLSLANSLRTVDGLFNSITGHTHSGAHQGAPVGTIAAGAIPDGSITTAKLANGAVTNAKLASDTARANLLTNGGFEVWQRGNGPFTGATVYGADKWRGAPSGTDTLSVSKNVATIDTALGSSASAACTFVLGSGAGNTTFQQYLTTGDGCQFAGRTLTLSIRVNVNVPNAVKIATNFGAWVYGQAHTGDGTWQTLTATMVVPPGTATIYFGVALSASCTAYIDNAMLVVGSVAADYAPLHPADDLARCLRYYEVGALKPMNVYGAAGAQMGLPIWFRAWKATSPTLTKVSTWSISNGSAPNLNYNHQDGCDAMWTCTALGATSIGPGAAIDWTAEANP